MSNQVSVTRRVGILLAHNLKHALAYLFPRHGLVEDRAYGLAVIGLFPALYLLSYKLLYYVDRILIVVLIHRFSVSLTILKLCNCNILSLLCLFLEITKTIAGGPVAL